MVVHRQPVQAEHAEHGAERAEEDGDLEGDRNEGGPGEKWLAANHEGVGGGVDPPLQGKPGHGPRQCHHEHDPGKQGAPESHRFMEAVDGERAVGVPLREAGVTHPLARAIEIVRRRELGEDAVVGSLRELRDQRHLEAPSGARFGRRKGRRGWVVLALGVRGRVPMQVGLRQDGLDLGGGHHRKKAHEQAEHREEEPEASEQAHHVPDRGTEVAPG